MSRALGLVELPAPIAGRALLLAAGIPARADIRDAGRGHSRSSWGPSATLGSTTGYHWDGPRSQADAMPISCPLARPARAQP